MGTESSYVWTSPWATITSPTMVRSLPFMSRPSGGDRLLEPFPVDGARPLSAQPRSAP
jgi:hypothetical protein